MRKGILALTMTGALALTGLAACAEDTTDPGAAKTPKIGVILPDSKSSARWETADRKYLEEAFKAAGVQYDIQNAQGDKTQFQSIADQMITGGVTVLVIVNLDSGTGKAVLDKAKAQGIPTIDYDRLTLGGGAEYYVSFDNVAVGRLQGEGLVKCLTEKGVKNPNIAQLNGSPTDNNATLFKEGGVSVLKPKYDANEYKLVDDQAVPDWDNAQGGVIFQQMLTKANGKIDGVLAANDGLGNAAISVLKTNKLNGKVPVTGQDATVQGLQNILVGDQCMTVYKAVKKEATATAELAIALAKGEKKQVSQTTKDSESGKDVPSVLLEPQAIYFNNVKDVVTDGYVTKDELCTADFAAKCTEAGIS
ncbi:sugar ABC transporter substrate-binding protein [Catellatospora bangladeshensis]|uniref:Sugar ABC transporter substrate-binding protein n=1 Tax=Catellatospora bangladeshensis TaxID=310355 RepID=A0A8J3NIF1_9ACTN|nr:sugar ABC transporter substrate-binding protein [Catellatospora bangladeshensis]GIF79295.1 sugar ABC transporter substrate-binding protein [Catellatospora bangladeshensis]